jgi:O-antigen ligase
MLVSFLWSDQYYIASQNALVFFTFVALVLVSQRHTALLPYLPVRVVRLLAGSTALAAFLYGLSVVWWGWGAEVLWGNRTFAMFALLGLSWFLAGWREGRRGALSSSILIAMAIAASLSRMAFAVVLLLFPLSQLVGASWARLTRVVPALLLSGGFAILSIEVVGPLRDRFTAAGTLEDILETNATMYTSGRVAMWNETLQSALESPWVGKGAGSAVAHVQDVFEDIGHPHSDYLRVLHDYGAVGLVLFLVSLACLTRACWQTWRSARDWFRSRLALASLLGLATVAVMMVTDNALVYIFVMAPLGVLLGTTLGSRAVVGTPAGSKGGLGPSTGGGS